MSGDHDKRSPLLLVTSSRLKNRHLLATRVMDRYAPFDTRHHQVLNPDIGERTARHNAVVSAPAPITIEIDRLNAAPDQIFSSRRRLLYRAGRRNMIGRNRVSKYAQRPGVKNLSDLAGFHREIFKERWRLNIVTLLIPCVQVACGRGDLVPFRILTREIGIKPTE